MGGSDGLNVVSIDAFVGSVDSRDPSNMGMFGSMLQQTQVRYVSLRL